MAKKKEQKPEASADDQTPNDLRVEVVKFKVEGLTDIMFDAVMGGRTPLPPAAKPGKIPTMVDYKDIENKMYYPPGGEKHIVFPADNILAFFTAQKKGAIVLIRADKKGKAIANRAMAKIAVESQYPPITRNSALIIPNGFDKDGCDKKAGIIAFPKKAKEQTKDTFLIHIRPVVLRPWEIEFTLTIQPDPDINLNTIREWLAVGGLEVGFGNHRPQYGRFRIADETILTEDS